MGDLDDEERLRGAVGVTVAAVVLGVAGLVLGSAGLTAAALGVSAGAVVVWLLALRRKSSRER